MESLPPKIDRASIENMYYLSVCSIGQEVKRTIIHQYILHKIQGNLIGKLDKRLKRIKAMNVLLDNQ